MTRNWRWRLRTGERRLLLVLGDLAVAALGVYLALLLWARVDYLGPQPSSEFIQARAPWFVLLPFAWVLLMVNLYDVHRASSIRETLQGVFVAALAAAVLYLLVYFTSEPNSLPRRAILYFLVLVVGLTLVWRAAYVRVFTAPAFLRRVVLVGAGFSGRTLLEAVCRLGTAGRDLRVLHRSGGWRQFP